MKHRLTALVAAFLFMFVRAMPAVAAELEVFAGSASKPATTELVALFEAETGHRVELFLGSSGELLSQMKIARRGDIYFPGSSDYMERAKRDGLIAGETEKIVAYLIPAINVARGNPKGVKGLEDLARPDVRAAIANPRHVCVGLYAVEALESAGLGAEIRPRIMGYTESCAKTVRIVEPRQNRKRASPATSAAPNRVYAGGRHNAFQKCRPGKGVHRVCLLGKEQANIREMGLHNARRRSPPFCAGGENRRGIHAARGMVIRLDAGIIKNRTLFRSPGKGDLCSAAFLHRGFVPGGVGAHFLQLSARQAIRDHGLA
jgi:molybdenum ABC transporter molybdate-binding protein